MQFPMRENKEGLILNIDVVPNSKEFEITGINTRNDGLKVKIKSMPEKGKANSEIIKELSKIFCAKAEIISGKTSRKKKVLLKGDFEKIAKSLSTFLK